MGVRGRTQSHRSSHTPTDVRTMSHAIPYNEDRSLSLVAYSKVSFFIKNSRFRCEVIYVTQFHFDNRTERRQKWFVLFVYKTQKQINFKTFSITFTVHRCENAELAYRRQLFSTVIQGISIHTLSQKPIGFRALSVEQKNLFFTIHSISVLNQQSHVAVCWSVFNEIKNVS